MITAQVVLINKEGLVLGVSRKTDHNDFGLPGGKMDPPDNGDPMKTAIRECKEETGLDVSDLKLVFAIHKSGNMGFTYLANYEGEINHNEPHVVKWVPFDTLIRGSFGKYNQLVCESLSDMGIRFLLFKQPKKKYLYAIDKSNFIHFTSEAHWKKHKTKELVLKGEALEDLYYIAENNKVVFHDLLGAKEELFLVSRKDDVNLSSVDEIKELLESCGFKTNKAFTNYVK